MGAELFPLGKLWVLFPCLLHFQEECGQKQRWEEEPVPKFSSSLESLYVSDQ